jgi:hypothetical protein
LNSVVVVGGGRRRAIGIDNANINRVIIITVVVVILRDGTRTNR